MDPHLEAILGPDPTPFETLISNLMKPSNEVRSHAESLFILCKQTDPNTLVEKLVNLLEHSSHLEVRAMSAVLLRSLFKQTDANTLVQDELPLWNSLLESTRSHVKSGLLNCVVNEQNRSIIRLLSDTISEFAANILADNGWPELIPFMLDRVTREDFRSQESALRIFAGLAQYVGDSLGPHITDLHGVFMKCLGNVGSADVRIAALIAVLNFIQCLKSSSDRYKFQDLLPRMMQCLTEALNDGNEATVQEALNLLIELAKTGPMFYKRQLVEVVGSMLQIAETGSLEELTKHLAIELVIKLVEAWKWVPRFISRLFAILMGMLLDIEDEDAGESSNYSFGQECLDRLTIALGRDTIVRPVAYGRDRSNPHLAAPNHKWQKHLKLVALVALPQSSEMNKDLEPVVTMVLNSFQDPHPRVRRAAINAIGKLSTYLGPYLQDQYHARVLPALALALDDFQNPRVQADAFSVVLNFSSHCRPHILARYLDGILNKLIVLPLTDPNIRVLKLAKSLEESTDDEILKLADELGDMFKEPLAVFTVYLVQPMLLRSIEKKHDSTVMKRLCHTIASFYNELCIKTGWPELIYFVELCALGYNHDLLEAAMLILGQLQLFTENYPISLRVYYACLEYTYSADIRIAAFSAAIGYIRCTHKVMDKDLVPAMTEVLTEVLNEGQEVATQGALKLLIEWAHQIKRRWFSGLLSKSYDAKLLKHLEEYFWGFELVGFVSSAIEIAESQNLNKETRHLAIDFVITLGEGRHNSNVRELMTNKLFGILMSDIENEAASQWVENEDDDAPESRNFSILLKFFDRLARILDKDSVAWPKLEQYLVASEWQKRVIAIVALARKHQVLKVKTKNFDELVKMVLDLFQDSHHRVRLAAINATGQFSTNLDPNSQLEYHRLVLPALAKAISDFQYPQVQEHAASAMINISNNKNIEPDILERCLSEAVSILLEFLCDRKGVASDQTRILAIKNLLKQFRANLPDGTWVSIRSSLRPDHQEEFMSIVAHRQDKEKSK